MFWWGSESPLHRGVRTDPLFSLSHASVRQFIWSITLNFFFLKMLGLEKLSHKSYSYAFYSLCGYRARIKSPANSPGHLYFLRRFRACDSLLWDVLFVIVLVLEWDSTQILSVTLLSCMCSLHVLLPEPLPHLSSPWWPGRGCTSMAKDWH